MAFTPGTSKYWKGGGGEGRDGEGRGGEGREGRVRGGEKRIQKIQKNGMIQHR